MKHPEKNTPFKSGPVKQKILLLLAGGIRLSLTRRPDAYFRIVKDIAKEWRKINHRSLRKSIRKLYQSKLISCEENADGTIVMTLTAEGEKRTLRYKANDLSIKKPAKWDGAWRLVIFDIPEKHKQGRDALNEKLKKLGFYALQRSVFVHPYECKDEIDFIVELFNLAPYVRFIRTKDIDITPHLRDYFGV